jgi:hypothetical protein
VWIGWFHLKNLDFRVVLNFLDQESGRHCIYGLLEVAVTVARQFIKAYKARTGERLSFTGYLAFCLARAIDEYISVQAYLKGRKQLVVFDDVDVGMKIERQMGETRTPVGHVIRRANHKTFMEIQQEIRAVQAGSAPRSDERPLNNTLDQANGKSSHLTSTQTIREAQ